MSRFNPLCTASSVAALLLLASAPLAMAGAKDDVLAGAAKLSDAPNYSWTSTATGGRGGGTTSGKTQKDGATTVTIPVRGGGTREIVMQGGQVAVQTEDGWQNISELANAEGPMRFMATMVKNFKTPDAQAKMFLDSVPDLTKADDGSYSADLPEDAAKKMLSFGGRPGGDIQVSDAKGSGKFWLGDGGMLSRMQVHMTGTISFNGNDRPVDRTTTTEIKDVGTTTVDVPAEAKAKLTAPPTTAPATQP
jgi:hypothetical protein